MTFCRSVHAEMNAVISASRDQMIGGTLYLSGREVSTGEYVKNSMSCSLCKRVIINSGIERVIIRDSDEDYRIIEVMEWVMNDESVSGARGY